MLSLTSHSWASLYASGNERVKAGMLDLAKMKLSCGEPTSEQAQVAALGLRVILEFDIAREIARAYDEKLVDSYMHIAFVVPAHREYLRRGTPSEPILAEASAHLLSDGCSLASRAPDLLAQLLANGLLARGERGELVGRLLWTIAHDHAIQKLGSIDKPELRYHQPILVLDWLKCMISPRWHSVVFEAKPVADPDGMTLREAFQGVYLNFSHFVRAGDYAIIGPKHLWMALVRHMAYQCADNQQSTDLVAPAHHGGPEAHICIENTAPIFGQIRNRQTSSEFLLNPCVGGEPKNNLPTLSLIHELGLQEAQVYPHPSVPAKQLRPIGDRKPNIHLRHYQIHIEGCTHEAYGVIPQDKNHRYKSILAATKIDEDFPRKGSNVHREALLRLKPAFFAGEPVSLSWAIAMANSQSAKEKEMEKGKGKGKGKGKRKGK